jgi:DNA (cytosine-5)-methyltransferase 1
VKLLDLYCGAGGCSRGYALAGFDVTGVDLHPQPHYPGRFVQMDALEYVVCYGHEYDAIHASPPCKHETIMMAIRVDVNEQRQKHPELITPTRKAVQALGKPYVIENVRRAVLIDPIMLCGTMFGLPLIRHRFFESNVMLFAPAHRKHEGSVQDGDYVGVYGTGGAMMRDDGQGRRKGSRHVADWRLAMGIDWMTKAEITQAIPPEYTRYIGLQLLRVCEQKVEALP